MISNINLTKIAVGIFSSLLFVSCADDEPIVEPLPNDEHLLAGKTTIVDESQNAFGNPIPQLTGMDELNFFVGNSAFRDNWVSAPAATTARDGLGPLFNARSCGACHFKDGRGRPPLHKGEKETGFLIRLSVPGSTANGSPKPVPHYGGQLQDMAINGVPVEAKFEIIWKEVLGAFPDGEKYSLRKPEYQFSDLKYGPFPTDMMTSGRVGQQMIGLGLLEAISDDDLLKNADPNDLDKDGISGRPNYVWSKSKKQEVIGRFGWKSNMPSMEEQVLGAFLGDIGITSYLNPDQNCADGQTDCQNATEGGNPELNNNFAEQTILYSSTLAVPQRRNYKDEKVQRGKKLFAELNCVGCHKDNFTTSNHKISVLQDIKIKPYTDLLLHDMGAGLADNRPDFKANGKEWRTQPLWGIGLIPTVNGHSLLLHDGRARNIQEAILWHGGEAEKPKEKFMNLSKTDRVALLSFVESL
ncbi:MAG: thiol oxidoreductase [Flavobacteriales bacterium]|jgi:CxxC motif-containing protein (DUF1111 family)|nr:thiol oxidoreductase [Flavobacteriales bacterium]